MFREFAANNLSTALYCMHEFESPLDRAYNWTVASTAAYRAALITIIFKNFLVK